MGENVKHNGIPEDIMRIAIDIVDRIATKHIWRGDCVEDVASAIFAERGISSELLVALKTLADKVDRFNGVYSGQGDIEGRYKGEMWFALKAAMPVIAKAEARP